MIFTQCTALFSQLKHKQGTVEYTLTHTYIHIKQYTHTSKPNPRQSRLQNVNIFSTLPQQV